MSTGEWYVMSISLNGQRVFADWIAFLGTKASRWEQLLKLPTAAASLQRQQSMLLFFSRERFTTTALNPGLVSTPASIPQQDTASQRLFGIRGENALKKTVKHRWERAKTKVCFRAKTKLVSIFSFTKLVFKKIFETACSGRFQVFPVTINFWE